MGNYASGAEKTINGLLDDIKAHEDTIANLEKERDLYKERTEALDDLIDSFIYDYKKVK